MKNKFWTFVLSLVIAFGLWVYVVTVVSPESEKTYEVEVKFRNEMLLSERNLMVTSVQNKTVQVRLSGNRIDLDSLDSGEITVTADLAGVESAGVQKLVYNVSYPGRYADNAFIVLSQSPGEVTVEIAERDTKMVPVKVVYEGDVLSGYAWDKDDTVLDVEEVTISGPDYVLNQITQAVIRVDLAGRNATFVTDYNYILCDANGNPVDAALVETNVKAISALVKIQKREKIELVVVPTYGAGATKDNTTIKIEPAVIDVAGSEAELEKLKEKLQWTIDLSKVENGYTVTYQLEDLLSGVKNLSGTTKVTVTVTYTDLETAQIPVSDFVVKGGEGLNLEFVTKELMITVRGPKATLDILKAKNITVTIDLTGVQPGAGTISVKPTVVVDSRYISVGVFEPDSYTIWVEIGELEAQSTEGDT